MSGPGWYKRDPKDFLEGVQGMGPELIGAYAVILDLIYARDGNMPRDDRHLSGVMGCSVRKARALTDDLIARGKLSEDAGRLANGRAEKVIFERKKWLEKSAKGGRSKAENEAARNENNDIAPSIKTREDKNIKREPKGSQKRGSRISDDWLLPRDWGQWALSEGAPEPIVRREADKFRDYWLSAPGQKGVKTDWFATWRNWMRKRMDDDTGGPGNGQSSRPAPRQAAETQRVDRLLERAQRRDLERGSGSDESARFGGMAERANHDAPPPLLRIAGG